MSTFFDLSSEVNTIHPTFVKELRILIRLINVEIQKIDNTRLDTYKIVVAVFSLTDKAKQVKFFEKIFLVANVSLEIVFIIIFLTLNSTNIDFLD